MSHDDNVHSLFEPDLETVRAHLEQLFRMVRVGYPDGRCEIAWDTGKHWEGRTFPITPEGLDRAAAEAVQANRQHHNVYMGVNPRKPDTPPFGRCSSEDVEEAYFNFVDADTGEAASLIRKAPLPYTWAVTTGRVPNLRPHAYWSLSEPCRNMEAWRNQQSALAEYFHTDRVIDPARLLRLAGTVSYPSQKKMERGYRVELVTLRTIYGDEEREPVASEDLYRCYPPRPHSNGFDPDTGEIHEGAERPDFSTGRTRVEECIRNIEAGHELHNNARQLVDHLISTGHANWLIRDYLTRLLRPVSDGGTIGQIDAFIRTWRTKTGIPNPEFEEEDFGAGEAEAFTFRSGPLPLTRPPRDWIVPTRLMREHITLTTAPAGVGKTTLAIEEAVSMASGRDFLGLGIHKKYRVAIVNNEETYDELERRIDATLTHYEIPREEIAETLFWYSGMDDPKIILARSDRDGNVMPTRQARELQEKIATHQIDVLILDPLVQIHFCKESSNEEMSRVMQILRSIVSGDHKAALHLIHHNRKPFAGNSHQAGDMSAARGASSMAGEAHFVFTLVDMSEQDAEKLNIPEHDRLNFVRLDDAKRKMAPAQGARWFERYGQHMPYGLMGEEIGILIPHEQEELENKVSSHLATQILTMIDKAWKDGNPYSSSHQAKDRYVVAAMVHGFQITRQAAKHLIADWVKNAMIATDICDAHNNLRGLKVLQWPG